MFSVDVCIGADEQLSYSIETWTCQLQDFVNDVIQQPVYLAGNSLGGLLSAHLAATQAHLCKYGLQSLNQHALSSNDVCSMMYLTPA